MGWDWADGPEWGGGRGAHDVGVVSIPGARGPARMLPSAAVSVRRAYAGFVPRRRALLRAQCNTMAHDGRARDSIATGVTETCGEHARRSVSARPHLRSLKSP